MNKNTSGLQQP